MKKFIVGVCLLILSTTLFAAQTIKEIKFSGNRKVEKETLHLNILTRVGQPFDEKQIAEDIYKLFALGYFENIEVFKELVEHPDESISVNLNYKITEKPAIQSIEFSGMEEFESDHFKDKVRVKPYTIVDEKKISEDLEMIKREYVDKGYYLVDVTYETEKIESHEVILKYVVQEHNKVKVRAIRFLGNAFFADTNLKDRLFIKEYDRLSWMGSSGLYKDEVFDRDTRFLEFYYMDNGFVRVKVAEPNVSLLPDKEWIDITYSIQEGKQYYVNSLEVTGDIITSKQDLLDRLRTKPEKLYRHSHFIRDIETLTDYYADFGYAFVNVTPNRPVDDEKRLVSISYDIQKGDKVFFSSIQIEGNDKTRDNVIRRQLTIVENALYSGSKLKDSKARVERLGFFKEVTLKTEKVPNQKKVKVVVTVKEKTTGSFQVGVGYSPSQGAFFTSQISENNVLGYGQRVSIDAQFNPEGHRLSLSWREPYLLDSQWNVGASIYNSIEKKPAPDTESNPYKEERLGGRVSVGHPIFEDISLHFAYRLENIEFVNIDPVFSFFYQTAITSSIEATLERNKTNNYLDPSSGSLLMTSLEYAGRELGGDRDFAKITAVGTYYYPLQITETFPTYFRFNSEYYLIFPTSSQKVPINERFKSGGVKSNRGYRWSSLSPTTPIQYNPHAYPRYLQKGGDRMLQLNFEYYVPLIPEAGLKGLTFIDASQVFDDDEAFDLKTLKPAAGFGIRWITPIAPLRFELGWPYDTEAEKFGEKELHFYIGP